MKRHVTIIMLFLLIASVTAAQTRDHSSGYQNTQQLSRVLSDEFTLYYLEDELGATIQTYLDQNEPPMLYHIDVSPVEPGPDDDIVIEAEIRNNPINTDSETLTVNLYYSYDYKETWDMIDMEDATAEGKLWTATIPAMEETGTLHYFFVAEDDSSNYYIEAPETEVQWASEEDEGYLVSVNDENRIFRIVDDDIDMLSLSIAYDGEILYFKTVVEGDVSGGTVTPFHVNLYSVGFFFPDSPGGMGPKPDYVLTHSQHAQFLSFPIIGLLDVDKNLSEIYAANARYYSLRNSLYMRIEQAVFDKHDYDAIRIVFGTANGTHPMPLTIETKDISSFVNFVPGGHSIRIK